MSGAVSRRSLAPGERSNRPSPTLRGASSRPSGTPPRGARSHLPIHNRRTADPVHGPAITSIAATGMPPKSHEQKAVSVVRPRPLGTCAHRMALYKVIRQHRPARTLRGDWSERDAPLRQAEGTGLSNTVTDRTRDAASQSARTVHGRPRIETRVKESHRGETRRRVIGGASCVRRAGLRSSCGSPDTPDRSPTDRPDPRDFGPTARSREGLLMTAIPHRREATWRGRSTRDS